MIRDITLGQYYSVDSVIHKLDPRVNWSLQFYISYRFMWAAVSGAMYTQLHFLAW